MNATLDQTTIRNYHDGRFVATGRWGPPTLPWSSARKYVENGWCDTLEEGEEMRLADEAHRGERSYHVRIMDLIDPANITIKTILSPIVPPDAGTPALLAAEEAAWGMVGEVVNSRHFATPEP